MSTAPPFPRVLPMRERAAVQHRLLKRRLAKILPAAMRAAGIDCWLILCQEDNLDPVYATMLPLDTRCSILQVLVFFERGDRVEGINLSGTNTHDLCDVGLRYLGLNSDHQQLAYVRRPGESDAPAGLRHLLAEANASRTST